MSRHARRRAPSRRGLPLLPVVTLSLAMLGTLAALVVALLGPTPPRGAPERPPAAPDTADAVLVREATSALRTWDDARARAWASADVDALAALYAPGSAAGEVDVSMLRQWRRRGLAVEGLRTQVLGVRVLDAVAGAGAVDGRPDELLLAVTDRLAAGRAVPLGGPRRRDLALPTGDLPTRRAVTLRRDDGGVWRVVEVRPLA